MKARSIALTLGTAAGGLLAAALVPVAVAFADEDVFTPDTGSFNNPTEANGFPPIFDSVTGSDSWNDDDLTTGVINQDAIGGFDTVTTFGPFTNYDLIVENGTATLPNGTEIDFINFGGGFENEFIEVPEYASNSATTMTDMFITPFGDFFLPI